MSIRDIVSKFKSITPFILLSLLLHILAAWYLFNDRPLVNTPSEKVTPIKSYLIVSKPIPKKPASRDITAPKLNDEVERKTDTKLEPAPESLEIEKAKTPLEPRLTQPEQTSSNPNIEPPETANSNRSIVQTNEQPVTKQFSAASAAQSYFNQMQNEEINKLSQQSLAEFRQAKPLNEGFSQSSKQEVIDKLSAKYAAPNSGVKVIAETSHNEKLLSVKGNCFAVKRDENGDEQWLPSSACGYQDPFNGQLQKSLNKYIKKKINK